MYSYHFLETYCYIFLANIKKYQILKFDLCSSLISRIKSTVCYIDFNFGPPLVISNNKINKLRGYSTKL